jgi:hypothetical protein
MGRLAARAEDVGAVSGMYQQNPDGSWSEAIPLGWQGGLDWEVYSNDRPMRAKLFDEDVLMAVVTAHTRIGLALKMRRAQRRARG